VDSRLIGACISDAGPANFRGFNGSPPWRYVTRGPTTSRESTSVHVTRPFGGEDTSGRRRTWRGAGRSRFCPRHGLSLGRPQGRRPEVVGPRPLCTRRAVGRSGARLGEVQYSSPGRCTARLTRRAESQALIRQRLGGTWRNEADGWSIPWERLTERYYFRSWGSVPGRATSGSARPSLRMPEPGGVQV